MAKLINIQTVLALVVILASRVEAQKVVDVTKHGAKPNGPDMSQALTAAWKEACASTTPSKILIPKGTFSSGPVTMEGPCKAPIVVEVQGTIKALTDSGAVKDATWFKFLRIEGFKLLGGGTFDGQGPKAWGTCANQYCKALPINLRFDFITNGLVQDITSLDSKQFHVNVISCKNFNFERFTVTAPAHSLNTDGIHIGRSDGVSITDSKIGTGDDCVSIGDGSKNITITKVTCGPGHGISVGSLGKYQNEEPVAGINVKGCTISNTDNGVRIKTWPASYPGTASDIHFEDITMTNVSNPILLDQIYCPSNQCNAKEPSKVKLSNISFKKIHGTSATAVAVKLVCSSGVPCDGVELADIELTYSGKEGPIKSECANVKPKISGKQTPTICGSPVSSLPGSGKPDGSKPEPSAKPVTSKPGGSKSDASS